MDHDGHGHPPSPRVTVEREDGTLLRAKAIPHGITGHLLAKLISVPVELAIAIVPLLMGHTADVAGLKMSLAVPAVCYAVIMYFGWYARRSQVAVS